MRYFLVISAFLCLLGIASLDFRDDPVVVCEECAKKPLTYETCAARGCTRCAVGIDRCCCLHVDHCTCPPPPPNPSRKP